MKGYLDSCGVRASQKRISKSLSEVAPFYHILRRRGIEKQVNPQPYWDPYMGYNIHPDQNEKVCIIYHFVHRSLHLKIYYIYLKYF